MSKEQEHDNSVESVEVFDEDMDWMYRNMRDNKSYIRGRMDRCKKQGSGCSCPGVGERIG